MEKCVRDIADRCLECGLCGHSCRLLAELGESPKRVAERGATAGEAFSCMLCGRCEAVCPEGLSPREMFAAGRRLAVAAGGFAVDDYRYLLPDRENNLMSVYRRESGIDYDDVAVKAGADSAFFPGCTLMTYAPALTRAVEARLREECGCGGVVAVCCGKPLVQLGLAERAGKAAEGLVARLRSLAVRELIVACPGCYYELRSLLAPTGIGVRTVYEALGAAATVAGDAGVCTVHDSCPDRFAGVFGRQVRERLAEAGFSLAEMAHGKENTICCGSGGMVSNFRPDIAEETVGLRLAEARDSGADILVSYCASCAAKFAAGADGIRVEHALGLLLGRREDFSAAKKKMAEMLEGPEGEKIWAKIMAD